MSASDIRVLAIVVPNPQYDNSKQAKIISSNVAYTTEIDSNFQTLSNNNPNNYPDIEGLLYVPSIPPPANDACALAESAIPTNATTLNDFPTNQDYPLVAIFPWTSSVDCTEAYLAQARADAARAAMVFQPNTSEILQSGDGSWSLSDDGRWKSDNQYPIYAVTAAAGNELLTEMTMYSGSMSDAPNGSLLVDQFDARDYPRLFAHIDLQGGTNVPNLWIFLIIVLAVLLGIVIIASIVMHIVQRHQRRVLQRRLERGEVDLESLGIKKMNVPQPKIDEMPKYTFTEDVEKPVGAAIPKSKGNTAAEPHATSFSQSTCPICLDDFVVNETQVRELPCKHIFHPECIDVFLRDNSSLCPMCKKSALPQGYCPVKVTNLMVRRERLVRRMRERRRQGVAAAAARAAGEPQTTTPRTWFRNIRYGSFEPAASQLEARRARIYGAPQVSQAGAASTNPDVEMGQMASANPADPAITAPTDQRQSRYIDTRRMTMAVPSDVTAQGPEARRAWRRERLARQQQEQYDREAETARNADVGRPLWRRVVGRLAPGFD